jgi:hypothetical protein
MSNKLDVMDVFATAAHRRIEPRTQDPLGFAPAVNALSAYFSPSLTATTNSWRYFAVLCAGLLLRSPKQTHKEAVLRFERLWAFGSVAAGQSRGIRGVQSVKDQVQLTKSKELVPVDYPFFRDRSQARQGVWGLYLPSAERLGLHAAGHCSVRGESLGTAMLERARAQGLSKAVQGGQNFRREDAVGLGTDVGIESNLNSQEAKALVEGLRRHDQQQRLARILASWRPSFELDLLARLSGYRPLSVQNDLQLVAQAAVALEELHMHVTRLIDALWQAAKDSNKFSAVIAHKAVVDSSREIPPAARRLREHLDAVQPLGVEIDAGLASFTATLESTSPSPGVASETLLQRHVEVQQAKGASAWFERRGDQLQLGTPRGLLLYNPFDLDVRVQGHAFRLSALQTIARAVRAAGVLP